MTIFQVKGLEVAEEPRLALDWGRRRQWLRRVRGERIEGELFPATNAPYNCVNQINLTVYESSSYQSHVVCPRYPPSIFNSWLKWKDLGEKDTDLCLYFHHVRHFSHFCLILSHFFILFCFPPFHCVPFVVGEASVGGRRCTTFASPIIIFKFVLASSRYSSNGRDI